MSEWFEADKQDLSIGLDGDELHIYLEQNYNGAVYASVKINDLVAFLAENKDKIKV